MSKIFLVLLSGFLLAGCNRLDQHQPITSTVVKLSEGESITQSIVSTHNNLNTVSICIRNLERGLIPMTFTLNEGDKPIRTLEFSSGNIDNADCTKFKFDPIIDSEHKTYLATISSKPPDINKLIPTILTVEKHGDDLHYKTLYSQPLREAVRESFAQFYSRLWGDKAFVIIWTGLVIYLVIQIIKIKK
jgi:hypothetical protein